MSIVEGGLSGNAADGIQATATAGTVTYDTSVLMASHYRAIKYTTKPETYFTADSADKNPICTSSPLLTLVLEFHFCPVITHISHSTALSFHIKSSDEPGTRFNVPAVRLNTRQRPSSSCPKVHPITPGSLISP